MNLSNSQMRWSDVKKFFKAADDLRCKIVSLDISGNAIGSDGLSAITTSKSFWFIEHLNISKCVIDADGGIALGEVMSAAAALRYLDMSDNDLTWYGAGAFSKGLEGNSGLEYLNMDNCNIGDAGVTALAAALSLHASLVSLSLGYNKIGAQGTTALCQALMQDTLMIHTLNLAGNNIQKDGAYELSLVLQRTANITSLDLSDNSLGGSKLDAVLILATGNDGVVSLAECLRRNKTLLSLNLAGNKIGKLGMRAFSDALGANQTLCRFLFDSADHVELISAGVKKNHSVVDLGAELPSAMQDSIKRNIKERDAFLAAVENKVSLSKVKSMVDKGISIWPVDPKEGAVHLFRTSPELIKYFHGLIQVRKLMFSSTIILDQLQNLPNQTLAILAKEKHNMTCLLHAARTGHERGLKIMLDSGADVNQVDFLGRTPLHIATEHGYERLVEILLQAGADINMTLHGLNVIMLAVKNGHGDLTKMYLTKFPHLVSVTSPPPRSRSLLHVAAKAGRFAVCRVLLEAGADPNTPAGDTKQPLHVAATPEICKLLITFGANVRATTSDGRNVIYWALFPDNKADGPNLDVVTFFKDQGADCKSVFDLVKELDVRNKYRDNLPVWIGALKNLDTLLISGNKLRSIPQNVLEGEQRAVMSYLKDIASGKKDVWTGFKIMVLGKEGVGKTHIFHLASGKAYPRNASTDGIDIYTFTLGEAKITVTWFDFGGQEVFYPTHELFLTGQCVYCIVFRLDDVEYDKRVKYWLNVVGTFAQDKAKVVIVGTHRDMLENPDEDEEVIRRELLHITSNSTVVVNTIFVNCTEDPKLTGDLISESLLDAAQQARLGGKEVPHIYNVIKDWGVDQKQREKPQAYFNWDQFVESFPGYDSYLLERACEFLHDMGAIFLAKRFVENKKANLVCVDIQWLAKMFSALITFKHNWIKDGVIKTDALGHVWKDFGLFDNEEILSVMSLFEKFNIAISRREAGCWIIPSMLTESKPAAFGDYMTGLVHARKYELSVLPSGAFGQILARISEWSDCKTLEMWRFGVILEDSKERAVMTVEGTVIHLSICDQSSSPDLPTSTQGSLIRRIDEELQQVFRMVFRRMETLPVKAYILCPHCIGNNADSAQWLEYEGVVKMLLAGERTFSCSGTGEIPLDLIGEDLAMGYVSTYANDQVKIEKEPLARGGFGLIFKGHILKSTTKIVVKELIVGSETEVTLFADFQREVSLMSVLKHENLVQHSSHRWLIVIFEVPTCCSCRSKPTATSPWQKWQILV